MRFQSFDCPLSAIEYPLPAKFCYIDFMKILHAEVRESEEAAEITRKLGWEVHNDQIEPGSFGGMCDAAWMTEAQFHRRQFTRKVCAHVGLPVCEFGCQYASVTGRMQEAKERLRHAIELDKDIRGLAIDDQDLKPLWDWIGSLGDC